MTSEIHDVMMTTNRLFRAGGEECEEASGRSDRQDVVEGGAEGAEDVKRGHNDQHQVEGVVVKDGKSGCLVVSDIVLLPQDTIMTNNNKLINQCLDNVRIGGCWIKGCYTTCM